MAHPLDVYLQAGNLDFRLFPTVKNACFGHDNVFVWLPPSEKFLKKSLKVRIWDLASICNFFELIGANFFLGRSGLACRAAYNCLAGTKKLLPAMYVTGYNFWCQHLTTVTKGRS